MSEYTGYESAFVPTSSTESNSPEIEVKTNKPSVNAETSQSKAASESAPATATGKNVLNPYRSVTYNFTLAALKKEYLTDPEAYRTSELDFVILKSGGKGDAVISAKGPSQVDIRRSEEETYDRFDARAKQAARQNVETAQTNVSLADGFNKNSPGRFDLFIENIEIETTMAFTREGGQTQPTQIKFDVIEPYSINGFIEALHVTAVAAGYPTYQSAPYVLKVEFWGYPDDDLIDFKDPEKIEKSERYFPLTFTALEIDVNERGTRYRCSAVPINERALGTPNVLKKPIKMAGTTVKDILKDFMKNINEQVSLSDKEGKVVKTNKHNTYDIKFPSWDDREGWKDSPENSIASSKLIEIFKDNALYKLLDPATVKKANAYKADKQPAPSPNEQSRQPESIKLVPGETVIQFAEGQNIHEAITAVVRDSQYVRDMLKDIKRHLDPYGMLPYFLIKLEVTDLDVIDETTKMPYQNFTYVVTPYWVHYTAVPTYGSEQIDDTKLKRKVNREYNYIYTGLNVDVINFKLNFNNLFFEAVPDALGNKDVPSAKTGAGPNNGADLKQQGTDAETASKQQVPTQPVKVEPTPVQPEGGSGGQPLDDPYSLLARKMHKAMLESTSMITGEIEILGDPFFLVTGGVGNYKPKPGSPGQTTEGEVAHTSGQVLIGINFRNPIDYDPTGMMYFDPKRAPFSGVYQVTQVTNTFRDGVFRQRMKVTRIPGQILDSDNVPSDPNDRLITVPSPTKQVVPDTTRSFNPSQRLDAETAAVMLGRGLPSPGLPGLASNFTAATGGLGGDTQNLLVQSPGRISRSGALMAGSSVIGQPLPQDIASNIRLNTSGLAQQTQIGFGTAALVTVAANVLSKNIPLKNAGSALAGSLVAAGISAALKKSNPGSGIGEGATVKIPPQNAIPTDLTAVDVKAGVDINPTSLAAGSVSGVKGIVKDLGPTALGVAASLGNKASSLVNNIGSKVASFGGTPADPKAIGAQLGLDTSKISGLGTKYQSKLVNQVSQFSKTVPENVNLSQASSAGLVLDYIPSGNIKNIPATQPYSVAPTPRVDQEFLAQVARTGGAAALANLYGVNNVSKISGNMIPGSFINQAIQTAKTPVLNAGRQFDRIDQNVLNDKINTVKTQLSSVTGQVNVKDQGVVGTVSSKFGSATSGQSPLDKLINKTDLGT